MELFDFFLVIWWCSGGVVWWVGWFLFGVDGVCGEVLVVSGERGRPAFFFLPFPRGAKERDKADQYPYLPNVVRVRLEHPDLVRRVVVVHAHGHVVCPAHHPLLARDKLCGAHREVGHFEGADEGLFVWWLGWWVVVGFGGVSREGRRGWLFFWRHRAPRPLVARKPKTSARTRARLEPV